MLFIYYPKCSTCVKALKDLKQKGIIFEQRDIVTDTPTKEELIKWIEEYNQGIKPFFNTSGLLYREMNIKEKINTMSIEEAALLLSSYGMLIKRPLLIDDDFIIIGYKEEVYSQI
ncbi:MAG: arsenate reductase family protein [Coprobacillus sp.]